MAYIPCGTPELCFLLPAKSAFESTGITPSILIVLAILAIAIVLMATERLRADTVALLSALALTLTGIIPLESALAGLSSTAVVTILGLFILSNGLYLCGVTQKAGQLLEKLAGQSQSRVLFLTMVSSSLLSMFMNNIAAAAVVLPAAMDAARRTKISPSKLLMPLSFATLFGGSATIFATSNIISSQLLVSSGYEPYRLFDFFLVGFPLTVVGTLYIMLIGRRLLPETVPAERLALTRQARDQLSSTYGLGERMAEAVVLPESPLIGQTIALSRIGEKLGITILGICREHRGICMAPGANEVLYDGDVLVVTGREDRVAGLKEMGAEILKSNTYRRQLTKNGFHLVEVLVAPRGHAAGKTLKDLHFREKFGLTVVALWRGSRSYRTDVGDMPLQFGDALLVHGPKENFKYLHAETDFLVLTETGLSLRTDKMGLSAAIFVVTIAVAALNLIPIASAALLGAMAMVVTGCLTMDEAYQGVEWKALILIAGMLAFGAALNSSGAAEWIGRLFGTLAQQIGPLGLAAGAFLLSTLLAQVIGGQVAAVVVVPIAIFAAQQIGAEPRSITMAAALGCSMAFLTPISHASNVLVMGPGGYRWGDYSRVGFPLLVLLFLTVMALLPIFWPLTA